MNTINFGIDLGTTNSLIAKYTETGVEVFKNPIGFKETLPSCIAFRGDRTLIGDKAREWLLKDPLNVFAGFKRKMGTSEKYFSPQKNIYLTPIELSAMVLAELKNFLIAQQKPESVVITIPASFDTVQSNATKKAGYEAGFKDVVLLQEPIAASLAFFNKQNNKELKEGKWLVYDLGGGTFDVALIGINQDEMRVLDHQGDNYLGGLDFDHKLVMEIILPKLIAATGNTELREELNKRNGKHEKLYYILLLKAEEAKKELSSRTSTEIEFSYDFSGAGEQDMFIDLNRDELNKCIAGKVKETIQMIDEVVSRNALSFSDLKEIIMIGGSTYIPYVRESIEAHTGVPVNCTVDPTTAVAIGAAYYAGNKVAAISTKATPHSETENNGEDNNALKVQLAYNKTTKDTEEYLTALITDPPADHHYRITRSDGGFDSGLKPLKSKIGEFITLRPNTLNQFKLRIFDAQQNEIQLNIPAIAITHGLFNVFGQPLPEDISIEVDDFENNTTRCQLIFERNSILPLVKTIYREISKTIKKNSEESLIINVLEGNHKSHPNTNQKIGVIEIHPSQLTSDLIKGSDVEIKIEISESRDVSVSVNLLLFNQQFRNVFSPTERYVSIQKLRDEIKELKNLIGTEVQKASDNEDYERAAGLHHYSEKIHELYEGLMSIKEGELSDAKYQLEEQKRKLAQQIYGMEGDPRSIQAKTEYYDWRSTLQYWIENYEDIHPQHKEEHRQLVEKEQSVLSGGSYFQLDNLKKTQMRLIMKMILHSPTLLTIYFTIYTSLPQSEYRDYKQAKLLFERGEKALERKNYDELRGVLSQLFGSTNRVVLQDRISGTGLG